MWIRVRRRLRSLLGVGWSADEFLQRYRKGGADAWGYLGNASHEARASRILESLPEWPVEELLELGCAQGFLTRRFLERGIAVTACDLCPEAIVHAETRCGDYKNARFVVADIREHLPDGCFDVCLLSDVLYYLSPNEIRRLSVQLSQRMKTRRRLIFANEWNEDYRDLTNPDKALAALMADGLWSCVDRNTVAGSHGRSHFMAILE